MKKVCVIDGQGGGIGSTIIRKIKEVLGESVELIALGTNAVATAQMLKAGANKGASGENAICQTVKTVDYIAGPIGIVMPHSLMGEVTPNIAESIAACTAKKFLIPLSKENIDIVGIVSSPLPHLVDELVSVKLSGVINENIKE